MLWTQTDFHSKLFIQIHLFHTNQPAVVLQRSTHILRTQCLHVCIAQCLHIKVCCSVMRVFHTALCVSVQSVRPHLANHYFYPCNCMTKLIQKALFLAQNIPFCLCTVPSCPIYSSLSKTLAVSCCSYPLPPPLCMRCNSWVWVCRNILLERERERSPDTVIVNGVCINREAVS